MYSMYCWAVGKGLRVRGVIVIYGFERSFKSILTRKEEADYAHKITICPFPLILKPSNGPVLELEQKGGF